MGRNAHISSQGALTTAAPGRCFTGGESRVTQRQPSAVDFRLAVGTPEYLHPIDLPRGTGRLGERLALGALLIALAGMVWLGGTVGVAGKSCPAGTTGTDAKAALSVWPPGQ